LPRRHNCWTIQLLVTVIAQKASQRFVGFSTTLIVRGYWSPSNAPAHENTARCGQLQVRDAYGRLGR
jgi:hypothetical protein